MRLLIALSVVTLAACGRTMPTTPLAACPPIAANLVRVDTAFAPQGYLPDGTKAPRIPLLIFDIFACGSARVDSVTVSP